MPPTEATQPADADITRATLAIHSVDCDIIACHELETTGRYAEQGYAVAFALANPDATRAEITEAARAWRLAECRGVAERNRAAS